MGTLAELTGLSPILLRAWERRHDLLCPERTAGGHRLYTEDDLRVLRRVQELLAEGRSIGEVAALGRQSLIAAGGPTAPRAATSAGAAGFRDDLVQAAVDIDAGRAERALDEAFAALSPERALIDVIEPALAEIGDRWMQGRCSVAGEHLVAGLTAGRLQRLFDAASAMSPAGPPAICACFPDEQHVIGALAVAYWLARRGQRVTWLGAALPLEDLERACDVLHPAIVCLSVTRSGLLDTHAPRLIDLARRRRNVRFHVGGAASADADGPLTRAGIVIVRARSFGELSADDFAGPQPARPARKAR
jgi:DNA-binding transcriptional MerR regulator